MIQLPEINLFTIFVIIAIAAIIAFILLIAYILDSMIYSDWDQKS